MIHEEIRIQSEAGLAFLKQVREICTRWPEVTEAVDKFGHSSFRVNDKPFVMMSEREGEIRMSLKVLPITQDVLLQQPDRYFKAQYIGHHGWVTLHSTDNIDWREIEELTLEGYLRSAPKRLQKLVNEQFQQ